MEAQLIKFFNKYSETAQQFSDSNVNFACHQITGFVRELICKSQEDQLSKDVFIVFSENIIQTVTNVSKIHSLVKCGNNNNIVMV